MLLVDPPPFVPLGAILTGSFFLVSAAVAVGIIIWSRRFVRQPQPRQVMWAVLLWVILHIPELHAALRGIAEAGKAEVDADVALDEESPPHLGLDEPGM